MRHSTLSALATSSPPAFTAGLQPRRAPAVPSIDGRWGVVSLKNGRHRGGFGQAKGTCEPPAPSNNRALVAQRDVAKKNGQICHSTSSHPCNKDQNCSLTDGIFGYQQPLDPLNGYYHTCQRAASSFQQDAAPYVQQQR